MSKCPQSTKAYGNSRKSSYHDDEEVEHTHPAQLALNQGHQVLEHDGNINKANCQSVGVTVVITTAVYTDTVSAELIFKLKLLLDAVGRFKLAADLHCC